MKNGALALAASDICLFKAGDRWTGTNAEITVNSNGTSLLNSIVLDRYGTGEDPIFNGGIATATWTLHSGSIYRKTGQPSLINTVGVDEQYALGVWVGTNTTLPAGTFKNEAGTLYIRLLDSSNPSGHTIYVPSFTPSEGLITTGATNGDYVQFNHLKSMYSNNVGFRALSTYNYFIDCAALGSGGDGYLLEQYTAAGKFATGSRAIRSIATFCCAAGSGNGQGFTMNSPQTWWINCTAALNFMAGFDFLDYSTNNNVDECGMVYCVSYKNGQNINSGFSGPGTSFDSAVYNDGGSNILIYGCTIHGGGIGNQGAGDGSNNAVAALRIDNEHPWDKTVTNVHVINNLIYDSNWAVVEMANDNGNTGNYKSMTGVEFINNTIVKTSESFNSEAVLKIDDLTTSGLRMRNNILYKTTGSATLPLPGMTDAKLGTNATFVNSDYNDIFNSTSSNIIQYASTSRTLANWQASPFNKDGNSLSSNPRFVGASAIAWASATLYQHGTYVSNSGTVYLCIVNHTSGTFATDLAAYKWTSVSTFLDVRLQRTALGQAFDSPCTDAGIAAPWTPPAWIATANVLADDGAVVGTTRSDGVSDDVGSFMDMGYHYYSPTPLGVMTSTNVQPASLVLATTNTVTISFTTSNVWPSNGKCVITFPTSLGGGFSFNSGGTSTATFAVGGTGILTLTSVGAVMTLTRSGGSDIAASTAVAINATLVLNPPQTGSTGPYEIKTTTSADSTIDIDNNVSADQIIAPAAGFKRINLQKVRLSRAKVQN